MPGYSAYSSEDKYVCVCICTHTYAHISVYTVAHRKSRIEILKTRGST